MDPVSSLGLAGRRVLMHHGYLHLYPLLLASIIAVVQLTKEVISACRDYPNGSADRVAIVNALEDLQLVLDRLHHLANDSEKRTQLVMVEQICQPNGPVVRCSEALTLLKTKLAPRQNTFSKLMQTVKWPLDKKDAQDVRLYLLDAKSTIQLALSEDEM